MKKNRIPCTWRLTLIVVFGCLGGLAVTLFGRYVDSISDLPLGPTPLSWTFKTSRAGVVATFSEGSNMVRKSTIEETVVPELDLVTPVETEHALFALGWFWGVDSRFGSIPGVVSTAVGYAGGTSASPDYRKIGDHSEVVRVEFDPAQVSYEVLLEVFWDSHDPGYDPYLRQYRNAVFYLNEDQRQLAEESLITVQDSSRGEVSTVVEPAGAFYVAEDYHQKYLVRKAKGILLEYQAIYPDQQNLVASTAVARVNGYLGCNGQPEEVEKELTRLGLSRQMQELLVEHMATSCDRFSGLTCPAPKRPQ